MPGLCHQDRINGVVRQRDLFGRAEQGRRIRQGATQHVQHLGDGIDGGDAQAPLDQSGGQLAGSGAEVEDLAGFEGVRGRQ